MSRAKYLTLITWLGQSAAARRFFFVFPFVLLATTARAPVVKSALVTVNDAPVAKKPQPPVELPADRKSDPNQISLFHSKPDGPLDNAPLVLRDTADFKPIVSSRDFPPMAAPTTSIAITNDPLTPQPVTQFASAGGNDDWLVTRVFDTSDTAVAGEIAGFGSGFGVSDPVSSNGGGGGRGTSSVETPVPEPVFLWLLPAATILLRRNKSLRI